MSSARATAVAVQAPPRARALRGRRASERGASEALLDEVVGELARHPGHERHGDARRPAQRAELRGEEDEDRPVPEVPGVGDAAEVLEGREARAGRVGAGLEAAVPPTMMATVARIGKSAFQPGYAPPEGGGLEGRDGRGRGRVRRPTSGVETRGRAADRPAARSRGSPGDDLPDPGERREVGGLRVRGAELDRVGERAARSRRGREERAPVREAEARGQGASRRGPAAARRGRTAPRPRATSSARPG